MKTYNFILVIFLVCSIDISAQTKIDFLKLVNEAELQYKETGLDESFEESRVKCNYSLTDNNDLEILYTIIPCKQSDSKTQLDNIYKSIALKSVLDFSGSKKGQIENNQMITPFNTESVREEFNADWGGTTSVVIPPNSTSKYKNCMILFLYKKGKGMVITYFLFKDPLEGLEKVKNNFHNLTFKK